MCKKLLSSLLGGSSRPAAAPTPAASPETITDTSGAEADVKNTDVVKATTGGREASGRVRLGNERKRSSTAVGLNL